MSPCFYGSGLVLVTTEPLKRFVMGFIRKVFLRVNKEGYERRLNEVNVKSPHIIE